MHTLSLWTLSEAWLFQKLLPGVHSQAWTQKKGAVGRRNFKSKHGEGGVLHWPCTTATRGQAEEAVGLTLE